MLMAIMYIFPGSPKKPVVDITASYDTSSCDVIITWSQETPAHNCVILFYTICYRQQTPYEKKEWTKVNVSSSNTNQLKLELRCYTEYEFQVVAWNEVGRSRSSIKQHTTKPISVTPRGMDTDLFEFHHKVFRIPMAVQKEGLEPRPLVICTDFLTHNGYAVVNSDIIKLTRTQRCANIG